MLYSFSDSYYRSNIRPFENIRWRRDFNRLHPQEVQYKVQGLPEIRNLQLRRNDNININVPTCYLDEGITICEYGNDKVWCYD